MATGAKAKPTMFAQVEVSVGGKAPVLTVPDSARSTAAPLRIVLSRSRKAGSEPREVEVGAATTTSRSSRGVRDGEQVVVAANFLIDAETT